MLNNGFMLWIFRPFAAADISWRWRCFWVCAEGRREGKREEREINKTEENRSINISAAAPFTDFS